jgi:hypothetical protein
MSEQTSSPTEQGLLAEILVAVHAVGAEVTALKVANAQVIADARHRGTQVDDHETRIRLIETRQPQLVTTDDLDEMEQRSATARAAALAAADRKANFRLVIIGLVMTAVIAVINVAVALL